MRVSELLQEKEQSAVERIAAAHDFAKSHGKITVDSKRVPVTWFTASEDFGDLATVEYTYTVNEKTSAWSFSVGIPGGKDVEFATGEDEESLVKHMKRKKKIKPSAIEEYLLD